MRCVFTETIYTYSAHVCMLDVRLCFLFSVTGIIRWAGPLSNMLRNGSKYKAFNRCIKMHKLNVRKSSLIWIILLHSKIDSKPWGVPLVFLLEVISFRFSVALLLNYLPLHIVSFIHLSHKCEHQKCIRSQIIFSLAAYCLEKLMFSQIQ